MKFLWFGKDSVNEVLTHNGEDNLILKEGAHILNNCNNVTLTGRATVLESTKSDYLVINKRAKIQILNSGYIREISGNAKIGLIRSGVIGKISGNVKITTVNQGKIDYMKGKAKIGLFS